MARNVLTQGWKVVQPGNDFVKALKFGPATVPFNKAGKDVILRTKAVPVTPFDISAIRGLTPFAPVGGVGIVEEASTGASVKAGDVVAFTAGNWWSDRAVVSDSTVVPVSKSVPVEYAALFGSNGVVASRLLKGLHKGDVVVVDAATSSLGLLVLQLAKARQLRTVAVVNANTAAEQTEIELLKTIGADLVIPVTLSSPALQTVVKDLPAAKRGITALGGPFAATIAKLIGEKGEIFVVGNGTHSGLVLSPTNVIAKQLSLRGVWLPAEVASVSQVEFKEVTDELTQLIGKKELLLFLERYSLSEAPLAVERQSHGRRHAGILMGEGTPATWSEEFSSKVSAQSKLYNAVINAVVKDVRQKGPRVDTAEFPKPAKTSTFEEWLPKDWQKEVLSA
eukprot:TRINITY_DN138_c0_g1_i1.p2 TRINITY_DN138_c0_g1~~TRINITY_DN138_c0_g1_i1.p2  ORF type:complete len:394 (-),score=72.17 TRINITY_DN138_c0_g1_i1:11-1192(-)